MRGKGGQEDPGHIPSNETKEKKGTDMYGKTSFYL